MGRKFFNKKIFRQFLRARASIAIARISYGNFVLVSVRLSRSGTVLDQVRYRDFMFSPYVLVS